MSMLILKRGTIQEMDQAALEKLLAGLPLGSLRYFATLGSTNDLAGRWAAAGAPDLSLVVADEQTAGRGRLDRRWYTSPGAGLAFSIILRPQGLPPALASGPDLLIRLTALGALAVCETLNEALPPMLPAQIKWPNDVIATRRKLAGVLVELHWTGDQMDAAILGIGINVSRHAIPPAEQLNFPATCVEAVIEGEVDRWDLLRAVLSNLLTWVAELDSERFMQAWRGRLAFRGEWVQVFADTGQGGESPPLLEGQVVGLNPDGTLRLKLHSGEVTSVQFGEIRLRQSESAST
jgi:BirA family biotin operon repressor/biotin-[acetyl-CoA-carboxylase] ligase